MTISIQEMMKSQDDNLGHIFGQVRVLDGQNPKPNIELTCPYVFVIEDRLNDAGHLKERREELVASPKEL